MLPTCFCILPKITCTSMTEVLSVSSFMITLLRWRYTYREIYMILAINFLVHYFLLVGCW